MVFSTAAQFALVYLVADHVFSGPDAKLIKMVLYLVSCAPTANLVIAVCQREGHTRGAENFARGILFQYLLASVTMAIVTALALSIVYG
jgi:hypothetical protein